MSASSKHTRYMNKAHWNEIQRGYVFDAAMLYSPSDTSRPLSFFEPDPSDPQSGKVVRKMGEFDPVYVDGQPVSKEMQLVIGMKLRKVVILTADTINHNVDFDYIMVAPIFTLHKSDESKPDYNDIITDNHPFFIYAPKRNGAKLIRRYVDVSQVLSIHKGALIRRVEMLPIDRFELVQDRLASVFDLADTEAAETAQEERPS